MKQTKSSLLKLFNKILFGQKLIKKNNQNQIKANYDKTKFREAAKLILGHNETKSMNTDYQNSMSLLYSGMKLDLKNRQNQKKEIKEKENENKINNDKKLEELNELAEKEGEKINSSFFNEFSLKILENCSKENLLDLACKSFVGNTGIYINIFMNFFIILIIFFNNKIYLRIQIDLYLYYN
jgi:hypothetical protein